MSDDVKNLMDLHLAEYSRRVGHITQPLLISRIEELEAKLEKLERWQAAAFIAHGNLDLDIEANPEALAELKGQNDE